MRHIPDPIESPNAKMQFIKSKIKNIIETLKTHGAKTKATTKTERFNIRFFRQNRSLECGVSATAITSIVVQIAIE